MTDSVPDNSELRRKANEYLEKREFLAAKLLLDEIFDGRDAAIAVNLGYVFDRPGSPEYDQEKAISYYKIAANGGDSYAQHRLGGIAIERGNVSEAIEWYSAASQAGSGQCSYNLFKLYQDSGNLVRAREALKLSARQGYPLAAQRYAIWCILGKYGVAQIPTGILRYVRNIPALYKYIVIEKQR